MCDESSNAFNSNEIKTSCQIMDMCFVALDGYCLSFLHLNWEASCCFYMLLFFFSAVNVTPLS